MFYVYILESEADAKHWYVGYTSNLERRVREHNSGDSFHTKKFNPWKIKTYVGFQNRERAERFELYLKSQSGRAFSKKHF